MKKFACIILLLCLSGCVNQEQAIVCSTISQDESTHIQIEYAYVNDKKITHVKKTIRVDFNEQTLAENNINVKYAQLKKEYDSYNKIQGLESTLVLDEKKNQITGIIDVNLSTYDFKKDEFELGEQKSYDDITLAIDEISELGYYRCEESSK